MTEPNPLPRRVEHLLTRTTGHHVTVANTSALTTERSVWRYRLTGDPALPRSVIVRTHRTIGEWRTSASYLLNDYAATSFLTRHCCTGLVPALIVADIDAGVLITEDLGTGASLADSMAGDDPAVRGAGIIAYARGLGTLHAATAGRAAAYARHRRALGPTDPAAARISINEHSLDDAIDHLLTAASRSRPPPAAVRDELAIVHRGLSCPGEFLALSNGDPCPYNCIIDQGRARFFDFELAGYRHALLDVSYLHFGFHACYHPRRLPTATLRRAEAAYRHAAGTRIPGVLDDATYRQQLAIATAAAAILAVANIIITATPRKERTARTRGIIKQHAAVTASSGQLPALTDWLIHLPQVFR